MKLLEYNNKFNDLTLPWAGHRYFAKQLVEELRPNSIVELGTWRGTSMFSMLQGVKDSKLSTVFHAIDTWQGDKHAGFYEGDKYLEDIRIILDKYYPNCKVELIKELFDNALSRFEANSIDIIHIDGLHTYEAVQNDYHNWRRKLSADGVILFHDIMVKDREFGVWKLWGELKALHETHCFEFMHSNGLGILTFSVETATKIEKLVSGNEIQNYISLYEELKGEYRVVQNELDAIYNSKYWKLKEKLKRFIKNIK